MTALRTAALLLVLPLAACNKGPEKISGAPQPSSTHNPHATGGSGMPNDAVHGGMQSPHGTQNPMGEVELLVAGEVELAGEYAGVAEGFLFISTYDTVARAAGYTTKVAVASGAKNGAGHQVVPFTLGTGDFFMGAQTGDEFELKVQYDHDGMVNMGGQGGGTGTVFVPAKKGQRDFYATIEKKD